MKTTLTTHITATNLREKSIHFYRSLEFSIHESGERVFCSAKDIVLEINPDRYTRPGIKLYGENWNDQLDALSELSQIHETQNDFVLGDFCGSWIYLSKKDDSAIRSLELNSNPPMLGNYAGLSLETTDMGRTMEIYQALGFEVTTGTPDQGWILLQNETGFGISLMKPNSCPHLFFNPSMTFFNGQNNLEIIGQIRASMVPIAEEVTYFNKEGIVDNVILRDPGGYGFFIFND